jgi:hypothetical protein
MLLVSRIRCSFPSRASLFFLPLIFLVGCDRVATNRVLAQVLEITGGAFVIDSSQSGSTRIPMRTAMLISPGQTIETGENATAMISLLPGMVMQVNSKTIVEIDKLILTRAGREMSFLMDSRQAHVQVIAGSLCAATAETYIPTELSAVTPAGEVIATQKASFFLSTTTEAVRVTSAEGRLTLRRKSGNTATVNTGYFCDWARGDEATTSETRPVGSDARASQESQAALILQDKMPNLMAQMIKGGRQRESR